MVGVVEIGYTTSYALLAILSAAAAVWQFRSVKPIQAGFCFRQSRVVGSAAKPHLFATH
jgi:hypothetical protein